MTAEEQKVIDDAAAAKALADKKVVFDEDQQAAIATIINKRFATISSKHEAEKKALADETAALKVELEDLKAAAKGTKTGTETDEEKKQFKELLTNEKAQTKAAKDALEASKNEATTYQKENLKIRKEVAIRSAAGNSFLDMEVVMALVSDKIEYDEDTKSFVIREAGVVRQNSSLQNMTLSEYFEEFGKKRPFLVNSDVIGGAGSSENKGNAGGNIGVVRTKADLKDWKAKSQYISKFGLPAFEALSLK